MSLILSSRYPGRFNVPSGAYPQGSFKNRTAPGALDGSYLEQDWANDKEGFFQRLMGQAGITPNGVVDTATASQYYDALIAVISANSGLNTTRIDVATAATVNLTTAAPNTRHIRLTGSASIGAFTVAAGACYFVTIGGTFTIGNNASLITNTGATLSVRPGDTFILRALAANSVEMICLTLQPATAGDVSGGTNAVRPITPAVLPAQVAAASLAEVIAGVVANKYVAPSTLLSGYAATLNAASGSIKLPDWLGGLTLKWITPTVTTTDTAFAFSSAFNTIFGALPTFFPSPANAVGTVEVIYLKASTNGNVTLQCSAGSRPCKVFAWGI